jgi:predicted ATPase/DNA-binding SARP family transcriptional activator
MDFCILGPLEVLDRGRPLGLGGRKQRALLALLLLHVGQAVSTDRLVDELWGERPPATAAKMVQGYVAALRKLLPNGVLVTRAPGYLLGLDGTVHSLDLRRFETLVAAAKNAAPERAVELFREALALWRGPALGDVWFGGLAASEAAGLNDSRLVVLTERIELELALGRHTDLVGELESVVAEHPFQERLRAHLILALYRSGRQAEALAAYRQARATLDELGIEPSDNLRQLETQILTHDAALTPAQRQTNLPAHPTSLIGRGRELADVLALVRAKTLVTLTGAGGSGKTRLALAAADELVAEFADGVWFVSFGSLTDPELVESTIAQALGARGELNEFLRGKRLLLLLDNLEQLLPDIARTVAGLEAKVLTTSRERLNVTAEHEYPVPTLPLADAVALFTRRARQLRPRFEPDENVAEIARRLDGLPLALELAGARVNVMSPTAILERLDKRLPFLIGGARDVPERQRTLRATIDWSYQLLNAEERALFARLAIFAGGCTLEAAELVCAAELDTLASLVDKSLLLYRGARYSMLETVREYARELVDEAGETDQLADKHAGYFLDFAEEARSKPSGAELVGWLDRMVAEEGNLQAALVTLRHASNAEREARLVNALVWSWVTTGHMSTPRPLIDHALERLAGQGGTLELELLRAAVITAHSEHDLVAAGEYATRELRLAQAVDDPRKAVAALMQLGIVAGSKGDYADSRYFLEEALKISRNIGDSNSVAATLGNLGYLELVLGDYERAVALSAEALDAFGEAEPRQIVIGALLHKAEALLKLDRPGEAAELVEASVRLTTPVGNRHLLSLSLVVTAAVALERNAAESATRLLAASEALREPESPETPWAEPYEQTLFVDSKKAAQAALSAEVFARAWDEGRLMTPSEAGAHALDEVLTPEIRASAPAAS